MKLVEEVKINYNLELTDEETDAFQSILLVLAEMTTGEMEDLCKYIAIKNGWDEEENHIMQVIDEFCEYLYALPL